MDSEFIKYKFEDRLDGVVVKTKFKLGIRHVQVCYMFLCTVALGVLKGGTGVGLLAMVDQSRQNDTYIQVYSWDRKVQGSVLSSFFWGYTLLMIPADLFLKKVAGKSVMTVVLLVNGALLVAIPTIVKEGGWIALCNTELIMGMTHACLMPAMQSLISRWLPPNERKWICGLIYSGSIFGIIISFPIISSLTPSRLAWELVYYSLGMLILSLLALWVFLTASSPKDHPATSDKEREFIGEALRYYKKKQLKTPWKDVLKTPTFWAIAFAHISSNVMFVFLLVDVPAYLKFGLNISENDSMAYMTVPFIAMLLSYHLTSPTIEWVYKIGFVNYFVDITTFRKIVNAVGAFGTVFGLSILSFMEPGASKLPVFILSMTLAMSGIQYAGFLENHRDMSENFSGFLVTMTGAVSSVVASSVPFINGIILNAEMSDLSKWRHVFIYLAALIAVCNLVYTLLGSAERQFWDEAEHRTKFGYHNDFNQLELDDFQEIPVKSQT